MSDQGAAREVFAREVGSAVRRRRRRLGMTSKALAEQADVSASFITQLEHGRSLISLPRLYRVAEALDTTLNALLPVSESTSLVTRAGDGAELWASHRDDAQRARLLTRGGPDVALKAHLYRIDPADPQQDWFQHEGEDFVFVVHGCLTIELDGAGPVTLGPGDALHHDSAVPHRWTLTGDEPAEVLIVSDSAHDRQKRA